MYNKTPPNDWFCDSCAVSKGDRSPYQNSLPVSTLYNVFIVSLSSRIAVSIIGRRIL
ncbi:hypothetical protein CROQUDRAFT_203003 [Cronartium quercuum f. sp. fusiforme G11]|uniref:Uncharacterized protein n=1 Tax=Cronartium quercuum f. sp. fusiforme G11 TaxID=708437 RepID=A0A9P6NAP2_9BASI|nr:hypothetical protein CROQUDRAFT_203003 [Cronartium quercuum f. sp. fusiforme G11]